jgi:tripartite-type tricarboxylate transporter receptor subunit TctC
VQIWLALFGPAGMPEPVLTKLRAEVAKLLVNPAVVQRLNGAGGLEPFITTPAEFSALIRRDYDKYGKVVKDVGAKID